MSRNSAPPLLFAQFVALLRSQPGTSFVSEWVKQELAG
jgi:hypothetical protein